MFVVTVVFYFLNMKLIVCGRNDVCLNLESIDSAHAFSCPYAQMNSMPRRFSSFFIPRPIYGENGGLKMLQNFFLPYESMRPLQNKP